MGTRGTVRKNRGKRGQALHRRTKTKTLALKGGYRYGKKSKTMGKGLRLSIRRKKSRSRSRSRSRKMRGGNMAALNPADFETSTNNVLAGFPSPEGGQSMNTSGGYGFDGEYMPVSQCSGE